MMTMTINYFLLTIFYKPYALVTCSAFYFSCLPAVAFVQPFRPNSNIKLITLLITSKILKKVIELITKDALL